MTGHIHRSINFHFPPTHPSIQRSFVKLCAPIKRDFITLAKSHKIIMIIIPCFGPKNKYCANTCIFTSSPTATHFQQVVWLMGTRTMPLPVSSLPQLRQNGQRNIFNIYHKNIKELGAIKSTNFIMSPLAINPLVSAKGIWRAHVRHWWPRHAMRQVLWTRTSVHFTFLYRDLLLWTIRGLIWHGREFNSARERNEEKGRRDATGWHEIPLNMGRHTVGWLGPMRDDGTWEVSRPRTSSSSSEWTLNRCRFVPGKA